MKKHDAMTTQKYYREGIKALVHGLGENNPYSRSPEEIRARCAWAAGYYDAQVWGVR